MNKPLLAIAVAFLLVAVGVVLNQRRAKSCPLHRRWVGRFAYFVAVFCVIVSAALVVAAFRVDR